MRFGQRGVEIAEPKPLDGVAAAVVKGRASGGARKDPESALAGLDIAPTRSSSGCAKNPENEAKHLVPGRVSEARKRAREQHDSATGAH